MAQFLILFLILADIFVVSAAAYQPNMATSVNPSFNNGKLAIDEAPAIRRLGKHNHKVVAPCLAPSEAPETKDNSQYYYTESGQGQEIKLEKRRHHTVDKSVAGGGVILGGLATTFLVAVLCYIRATGRKNGENDV